MKHLSDLLTLYVCVPQHVTPPWSWCAQTSSYARDYTQVHPKVYKTMSRWQVCTTVQSKRPNSRLGLRQIPLRYEMNCTLQYLNSLLAYSFRVRWFTASITSNRLNCVQVCISATDGQLSCRMKQWYKDLIRMQFAQSINTRFKVIKPCADDVFPTRISPLSVYRLTSLTSTRNVYRYINDCNCSPTISFLTD